MITPSATPRLHFRTVEPEDAAFFLKLMNEPAYLENIGDRGIENEDCAREYISSQFLPLYALGVGYGPFLVVDRTSGDILGYTGLFHRETMKVPDFGYAFLQEATGRGLATEAAVAHMRLITEHAGLEEICAITVPANVKSARLLQKLGFSFDKESFFNGGPIYLWSWQAGTETPP